jgi:hypothetical protein
LKELARTRRRNADKVDPGIGRTRLGQRIFECVFLIGTRSAQSIMASGFTAAQTGRTHDRTRPMLQLRQKVLAKAPSTHDPKRTSRQKYWEIHRTLNQAAVSPTNRCPEREGIMIRIISIATALVLATNMTTAANALDKPTFRQKFGATHGSNRSFGRNDGYVQQIPSNKATKGLATKGKGSQAPRVDPRQLMRQDPN